MDTQKYRVGISFQFDVIDDVKAREIAGQLKEIFMHLNPANAEKEIKLQRIFVNRAPEKVEI